jgi:pimeloyl-ACP methyl ester carboxylesterase
MRLRIRRSPLFVLSLVVALTTVPAVPAAAAGLQEVAGEVSWSGVVAGVIEFFVTFTPTAGGSGYTATLDIPAQGLSGAQLTDIVYTATEIAFTLPIAPPSGATWRAARDTGATTATGELEQGATKVAFTMEMLAAGEEVGPPRPQTPQQPFPYSEREVSYVNEIDGAQLAGTLTVPQGAGPFPAVLLITGSGPQNRDEEILGHKPFWVIADHLSRNGIVALRVDDRGVGASTGDLANATTEDFAGDALAGVRFLAEQPGVNAAAVGLIGHSEGGIVAPMVAAESDAVAFVVLLAGPAFPGSELMVMQLEAVQRAIGRPEENIARQSVVQRRLLELAGAGADLPALTEAVAELTRIQVSALPEAQRPSTEDLEPAIEAQAAQLMAPWWRFFITFDPRTALRKVRCPVLALNGSLDTQVPAAANLSAIREALQEAGNPDVTIEELEGRNHLFQAARTGSITEYADIEETFSPRALELITEWIRSRFGGAPMPPTPSPTPR